MKKYYFVGNSLTYFYDGIYVHLQELLKSANKKAKIDDYCKANENLKGHVENLNQLEKIKEKKYDYVILQEESNKPLTLHGKEEFFFPYAKKFYQTVNEYGGKIVYYMTMARQNKSYEKYLRDQEKIRESYVEISSETNGLIVPVGLAWERMRREYPKLNLYHLDYPQAPEKNIHPNLAGIYLATCVFYNTLFGSMLEDKANYIPEGLSMDEAITIRGVANGDYDIHKNLLM